MKNDCAPPDPAGFRAWFSSAFFGEDLRRAARCGWHRAIQGLAMEPRVMDHTAAIDPRGQPRAGAAKAYDDGYRAGYAWADKQVAKRRRNPVEREEEAPVRAAQKEASVARFDAARRREEEARLKREMVGAARQGIWAIADVDERAGDKASADAAGAARRLGHRLFADDVAALGGTDKAVALYLKERRRVRKAIREERSQGAAEPPRKKLVVKYGRLVRA